MSQPNNQPLPKIMLLQRLMQPLTTWASQLWATISNQAPIGQLKLTINNCSTIFLILSDASVSPQGHGSCAWTIWSKQQLWQGIGYVPALAIDMYSGLAEAYGVYAALSFLQ